MKRLKRSRTELFDVQARFQFDRIRSLLIDRGVNVNPGFNISNIDSSADDFFKNLYGCFNGFPEDIYDNNSSIRILPFSEAFSSVNAIEKNPPRRTIADFLMGSDQYTVNFYDAEAPVLSSEDGSMIASDVAAFLERLASGDYDYL